MRQHQLRAGLWALTLVIFLGTTMSFASGGGGKKPVAREDAQASAQTNYTLDTNLYYYTPPDRKATGSVLLAIFKTILILGVLGIGTYYLVKYLSKKQGKAEVNNEVIRVISQSTISLGKHIAIVKVLDSFYIMSVAENGISLIKEVDCQSELEKLRVLESSSAPGQIKLSFQEQLKGFVERMAPRKESSQPGLDKTFGFLKSQKERLERMGRNKGGKNE